MYRISLVLFSIGCLFGAGTAIAHEPPTSGWALHIDAKRHITGDVNAVAHHYCKELPGGVTACQLYDSDALNARLVGVEFIIGAEAYAALPETEQALWHYHKEEIGVVDPVMPDMTEEEAAEFVKSVEETYGKIFLIWNTAQDELPVGQPMAYDMAGDEAH
ncbi:DUF1264 domain-containing protein [Marinobacter mobilis]|uniref:DUF1264 domain-containing protein n=1 Tax=Marinobacter mobilis TaxID=488533 RepID=A0A1H2S4J2_9GAMM|nr:DUF1264 domain-containing protein [Marinobacter mobilis]SDW26425.1 Protein of unknown function [Marinobacter mobilis]